MSDISFKPYRDALDNFRKDAEQIIAISNRLIASAEGVENEPIKATAKLDKLNSISAQMDKLSQAREDARNRYDAAIDAADAAKVQEIRGLCAYAEGTGQSSAGIRYLLEECKAFDAAKGDYKLRQTLHTEICDVVASVAGALEKQKGIVSPDNSILAQFESITDAQDATAFYTKHKDLISVQLQARIDSQNIN